MKKVIITGPTGAIGVALIEYLVKNGIEVIAVIRRGTLKKRNIPKNKKVKIVELDLKEIKRLPLILDSYSEEGIDTFYHLAWDGTFGNSRNNMQGQLLNIQYILDAVEVASRLGCKKFIGAGSQAEYGRVDGIKLNANIPTFPENGYGIAKLAAGQMSRILCEQKGMEHVWTRILSIYGPYDGENTMIMSTIRTLLDGKKPSLTAGEQQWDYLYSKDAGYALYLIGEKGIHGKVYCIGSGETRSLREYAEIIRDCIDPQVELGFGEIPYAEKQVMYLCADIDNLGKDTGFEPQYKFEEGIKETIDWYRER